MPHLPSPIRYLLAAVVCVTLGMALRGRPRETEPAPVAPPALPPQPHVPHSFARPWSGFRGPAYGVSPWKNAPLAWDGPRGLGVAWKTPLAASCVSSPVLWDDHVYLTEADENGRAVLAFDADSGRRLWRQVVPDGGQNVPLPPVADTALAMPTPACDGDGVYVLFGTGDLASFTHDGRPRWRVFLQRPEIGYGYASSPCVVQGLVCVQIDGLSGGRVLAVAAADGNLTWEQPRSRGPSWSSPIVVPGPEGQPRVVFNANGSATAFDLAGKPVWDVDGVTGQVTPSPAWWENRVYLVNVGSRLIGYDVTAAPKELWQLTGKLPDVASPVLVDGLLFMGSGSGQFLCVDARTGKEQWAHKCPRCYASLVASGDRVYALGRDGTMLIVAAARTYRELGTCPLGDGADATPALGDGRIYIRSHSFLWCIGAP